MKEKVTGIGSKVAGNVRREVAFARWIPSYCPDAGNLAQLLEERQLRSCGRNALGHGGDSL